MKKKWLAVVFATIFSVQTASAFSIYDCLDDLEDVFPYWFSTKSNAWTGPCGPVVSYTVYAHHNGSKYQVGYQKLGHEEPWCDESATFLREAAAKMVCDKVFINLGQPQYADYWP